MKIKQENSYRYTTSQFNNRNHRYYKYYQFWWNILRFQPGNCFICCRITKKRLWQNYYQDHQQQRFEVFIQVHSLASLIFIPFIISLFFVNLICNSVWVIKVKSTLSYYPFQSSAAIIIRGHNIIVRMKRCYYMWVVAE